MILIDKGLPVNYTEKQIAELLKQHDGLTQAAISKSLSNINKSSISRSLKKMVAKDSIRKLSNGTYLYRHGNEDSFKNPDAVATQLMLKLMELNYDVSIDADGKVSVCFNEVSAKIKDYELNRHPGENIRTYLQRKGQTP